jgi:subtilase family serine protease
MNQALPSGVGSGTSPLAFHNNVPNTQAACDYMPMPGQTRCYALIETGTTPRKGVQPNVSGYGPPDYVSAYHLPHGLLSGKGQKIAIVDAYDDPKAESDLQVYRSQYGLPTCTTANGCFKKVNQLGQQGNYPPGNTGWGAEESLDVDMASAICPHCKIILVEANSNYFTDLGASVDEAVKLKANVVSNSYGGSEGYSTDPDYDHPGHIITASSGDSGYGAQQPCSLATVVCVGGTTLSRGGTGTRGWTEQAWRDAGSGCSGLVSKPSWQTDKGCTMRSEADTSSVAVGAAVYDTFGQGGWIVLDGTSVSSPIVASEYALAKNAKTLVNYAQSVWQAGGTSKFYDITSGPGNGSCPSQYKYICTPGKGYDGQTGWGTAHGVKAY